MTEVIAHDAGNLGCACPACSMPVHESTDSVLPIAASLDGNAGTNHPNGKPIFSAAQVAAYLNRTGGGWIDGTNDSGNEGRQNNIGDNNSVITFGFFDTQSQLITNGYVYSGLNAQGVPTNFGLPEFFNFATFTVAQREAAREAMQSWDDAAAVTFREVNANDADINFANLASAPTTQAYAYLPTLGFDTTIIGGQVREVGGDIWVSRSQASNFRLDEGGYGLQTLTHEVGHALGLSHPGAYNAAPGLSITYNINAEYAQDTRAYTVMSYFDANSLPGANHFDFLISTVAYSGVPLIHDIAAIQRMYGADMTTRTGDTVYGFNSNAGRDSFDFTKTPAPIMAIWDAGGNDTIDASGYATNQIIDLTPGSLSSIGGVTPDNAPSLAQVNANRLAAGFTTTVSQATYDSNMALLRANPNVGRLTDNVGIAYGAIIENAIGGSGHDTLIGNSYDNVLRGNAGNDTLGSGAGNDTLDGGLGNDEMAGGLGNDRFLVDAAGDLVIELADEGTDIVLSSIDYSLVDHVENLTLTGSARVGTGNGLNNVITGNELANTLSGGAGNDRLVGDKGHDFMRGGSGADVFVAELHRPPSSVGKSGSFSSDTLLDFVSGTDKIDLSGFNFAGIELIGLGANRDAGDISFRVFTSVRGAETALGFDIDGIAGTSTYTGPVTVVYINVDGGAPDIALSLLGTNGVTLNDFLWNSPQASNAQLFGLGAPVGGEFTFA